MDSIGRYDFGALHIPSPTARSGGIIYPIVNDLALGYRSKPNDASSRRVGSYLMWVAVMTTCVTSSLFLTAPWPALCVVK